jgi:hypothetical protein
MRVKIALVPLDDRPCCFRFPEKLGNMMACELRLPPREWLGRFEVPGDCDRVASWVEEVAGEVDGLIVAVDQLAYGGLVASRAMNRSLEACLQTLDVLKKVKKRYPNLIVYAANVLMRISITSKNAEYAKYWALIFRYSQLYDRVKRLGEKEHDAALAKLASDIPTDVLAEYLAARRRNHEVNKRMIDWVAEGLLDFVAITQEDADTIGMHLAEQQELMKLSYEKKVQRKVVLYPGADEATQTLLARMLQTFRRQRLRVYPRYTSTAGRLTAAKFEDRPVEESVNTHLYAGGCVRVDTPQEADLLLYVNTPLDSEGDGFDSAQPKAHFQARHDLWTFVEGIRHDLASDKRVVVADVSFPNASDLELVQRLLDEQIYFQLTAYAGWNTAGNSLGTCISHAVIRALYLTGDSPNLEAEEAHYAFLAERLLDEWAYQAQVRRRVNAWLEEELQLNPTNLEEQYELVNARVVKLLRPYIAKLNQYVSNRLLPGHDRRIMVDRFTEKQIALPWNRTFEVEVCVECRVQQINRNDCD